MTLARPQPDQIPRLLLPSGHPPRKQAERSCDQNQATSQTRPSRNSSRGSDGGTWKGGIYQKMSLERFIFILVITSVPSGAGRILGSGGQGGMCISGVLSRGCFPYSGNAHCRSQKTTLVPVPRASNGESNSTLRGIQAQCQAGMFPERQEAMACQRGCEGFREWLVVFFPTQHIRLPTAGSGGLAPLTHTPSLSPRLPSHRRMSTPSSLASPSPSSEQSTGGPCHLSEPPFLVCDMVVN